MRVITRYIASLLLTAASFASLTAQNADVVVNVRVSPHKVIRTFDPAKVLGGAIDGHDAGEIARRLTPRNVSQMLEAGLGPITYRIRTELGVEAWHWNPLGTFSDPVRKQGYWTSSTEAPPGGISLAYGYALPRRGNTIDQANNDGYSRIDDGDPATYWKSNPYLDGSFTHDDESLHPQWVVIDLERPIPVNAIKILWGDQFATKFEVEYTTENLTSDFGLRPEDGWQRFSGGTIDQARVSNAPRRLSSRPMVARYLRITLHAPKHSGPVSNDRRDNVGFSIREVYVGIMNATGAFVDRLRHGASNVKQSPVHVSSNDPWHTAANIDKNEEHAGFDRLVASGVTRGQPMMVPVGVLYDTPENAAAEIKYLVDHHIMFDRVELGEEPDGQNVSALDYAALYLQFAVAIHKVAPDARLGGPSFQDIVSNLKDRTEHAGNGIWLRQVLDYLKERGHRQDFAYMSFEWYPYDNVCLPTGPQVGGSAEYLRTAMKAMWEDGLDRDIPFVITEYGYSPFAAAAEDDLEGAIVNLDGVGTALELGGEATYLYGYEPDEVIRESECTQGNNMILLAAEDGSLQKTATFHAASMMTSEWLQPGGGPHDLLSVASDSQNVGAYAARRPDGKLSILLMNRDPLAAASATIMVESGKVGSFDAARYSHDEYVWDKRLNRATRDKAPTHFTVAGGSPVKLAPYSILVLREK